MLQAATLSWPVYGFAVSRWRKGNGLSIKHAVRICELLDISLDWLVLGRGAMEQHRLQDDARSESLVPTELMTATAGLSPRVVAAIANLAASLQAELDIAQQPGGKIDEPCARRKKRVFRLRATQARGV